MSKMITAVLVGAGQRADVYSSVSFGYPEKLKIVGLVDPDDVRVGLMREKYNVPKENCFRSVEEFVKREKFADAVINGTMEEFHLSTSVPVLEKGYDLLLEKPFAVNEKEVSILRETAKKYGRKVVICHVLRYTSFYRAIKEHVINGEIGDIIAIEMCEHVNYHHMAVSYVRGKWRSEKLCLAPMLLAKSCHDMDIMLWMMNHTRPVSVASFGSDFQFGKDRKSSNAGSRCMTDCPMESKCIFSAKANYLSAPRWHQYVWKCLEGEGTVTDEMKEYSLKTDNNYGRCVWDFERDGNVDHQTVIVNFANGATGNFSMVGGSTKSERNIHIVGTAGEIKGTFEDSQYVVRKMMPYTESGYDEKVYNLNVEGDKIGAKGGHGGGDEQLVLDFVEYLNTSVPTVSCATLEDSSMSHIAVFKAEEARKTKTVVNIE